MFSTRLRVKELLRERRWTTKVLAEKTGMSESYLTHIKNGTRRWNEDALRKLAEAFELEPTDMFVHRPHTGKTAGIDIAVKGKDEESTSSDTILAPVMGAIPSEPSEYNNQISQVTTGYKDVYIPVSGCDDKAVFCLIIEDNSMSLNFVKGDYLIISPSTWTSSGDIVAAEYSAAGDSSPTKGIFQVNYMDDFVVFETVNHKKPPAALVRGKDNFRIIGKVIYRYQKL